LVAHADNVGIGVDDVADKTRFLKLPSWLDWALEAAEWMIGECLSNPIHAGETETTEEPEGETNEHVPSSATYQQGVSSIGKSSIYYKKAEATEYLDISFNGMVGGSNTFKGTLQRSGLGASTVYQFTKVYNNSNSVTWSSGTFNNTNPENNYNYSVGTMWAGYRFSASSCYYTDVSGSQQSANFMPYIISTSENQIPVYYSSSTTVAAVNNVLGYYYAENSFYSNSPVYISNHTLNTVSNNYFNSFEIPVSVVNAYIPSNTNINVNNYQNYADYGYYVNNNGDVDIDTNVLAAYLQGVLKAELEAAYKNFYIKFPEPGVTVGDDDIKYINPFEDDEIDTTSSGGVPALWDGETYILETSSYNVNYPEAVQAPYDSLKQSAQLPATLIQSAGGMISEAFSIIPSDFLSFYCFAMLLSIVLWFVFRK